VRLLRRLSPRGLCCPWEPLLRLTRLLGYTYTGYEVGHIQACCSSHMPLTGLM